ncbi:MAG: hypothetical protein WBQ73_02440, partial [Candidatus Babeliales bacterium]
MCGKILIITTFCFLGVTREEASDNVKHLSSKKQFATELGNKDFSAVFFYVGSPDEHDALRVHMNNFHRVSNRGQEEYSYINFVSVDLSQDTFKELQDEYELNDLPCIALFYQKIPLRDNNRKLMLLKGFASEDEIARFIDENIVSRFVKKERSSSYYDECEEDRECYGVTPYVYSGWYGWPTWYYYGYPYWRYAPHRYHHYYGPTRYRSRSRGRSSYRGSGRGYTRSSRGLRGGASVGRGSG